MSKAKKLYITMVILTIISIIALCGSIVAFTYEHNVLLLVLSILSSVIVFVLTMIVYIRFVKFACPKCNQVFKASTNAIIWAIHTPTKRLLKCPHCNTKSWCKEHFE